MFLIGLNGLNGDLRGFFPGKMEFPSGNAAESHAFQPVLFRRFQTGTVAGSQLRPMGFRQSAAHVGAYGVQHIPAGQVERGRELGLPDGFVMPLLLHLLVQIQP